MGLDDRDYMRERYRGRTNGTVWNDRKGRVEGAWFDPKHEGSTRQRGGRGAVLRFLPLGLSALLILIPMYADAQRSGWIPDFAKSQPFPESGSVTVASWIRPADVTSLLTVETRAANAVVQLVDPNTNRHVISIYVAANDRIRVPVPGGTFRMRLIEGQKWHGRQRYFGPSTSYETIAELMSFDARSGHIIDLHRRPDGNLKTRMMVTRPSPL